MAAGLEKKRPQEEDENIHEVIKMTRQLKKKSKELGRIIEMTETQANKLDDLKIVEDKKLEDLKLLLDELKITAKRTSQSGARLEVCMKNLLTEADLNLIGRFMEETDKCKVFAPSSELSTKLGELFRSTREFSNEFVIFSCHLNESEEQAAAMTALLLKKQKKLKKKRIFVAVSTAAGMCGLLALAYFTNGVLAPLVPFGAKKGFAYNMKQRKLARHHEAMADKLSVLAKEQKDISNMTGEFQVDLEAMAALEDAYKCHQLRMDEKEKMTQMQAAVPSDVEEIDELEEITARLENLLANLQALNG